MEKNDRKNHPLSRSNERKLYESRQVYTGRKQVSGCFQERSKENRRNRLWNGPGFVLWMIDVQPVSCRCVSTWETHASQNVSGDNLSMCTVHCQHCHTNTYQDIYIKGIIHYNAPIKTKSLREDLRPQFILVVS